MNYRRVIPRDLFNEGKLLNCYGRIAIEAEKSRGVVEMDYTGEDAENGFEIVQDKSDDSIYVDNLRVRVRGFSVHVFNGLNSREKWPMYALPCGDGNAVRVFNEDGTFTPEFLAIGR